jgi:hypothetical protein
MDGIIMTALWTPFKKIMSFLTFIVIKSLENSVNIKRKFRLLLKTALQKFDFSENHSNVG